MERNIKLIIGLSNEGQKYRTTYHNVGRLFTDQFQIFNLDSLSFGQVEFFLPPGFMNNIGQPIAEFLKNKPISSEQILVIHDDSDLTIGKYKFSFAGSSAGHRGVESVISSLGTDQFHRLRVGIRKKEEVVRQKAEEFVLKKWTKAEAEEFVLIAKKAWEEIEPSLG